MEIAEQRLVSRRGIPYDVILGLLGQTSSRNTQKYSKRRNYEILYGMLAALV